MFRKIIAILSCSALVALLPLASQAGFFTAKWPVTRWAPAGEALITFKNSALSKASAKRVWYTGAFEHLEYALVETDGIVLEAVYDRVIGDQTILDYHYWMEKMLDTWHRNAGQSKVMGVSKSARAWHGTIDYQLYRLQRTNQNCAGFNSEWDVSARDPNGRPKKVLFGYMCAKSGQALNQAQVETILKGVTLDNRFGHTFVKPGQKAATDEAAYALGSGTGGTGTGNLKFPFEFGTQYSGEDGDSSFGK
ncbi:MAG: hypothetical protein OEU46_06980 [Alphaproteobacteria bacterium]|nr:hypothetical protein [Alphaproteobacteria bacterium]